MSNYSLSKLKFSYLLNLGDFEVFINPTKNNLTWILNKSVKDYRLYDRTCSTYLYFMQWIAAKTGMTCKQNI